MIDYRGNNKCNVLLFITFQFESKTNTYKIAQTNSFFKYIIRKIIISFISTTNLHMIQNIRPTSIDKYIKGNVTILAVIQNRRLKFVARFFIEALE